MQLREILAIAQAEDRITWLFDEAGLSSLSSLPEIYYNTHPQQRYWYGL